MSAIRTNTNLTTSLLLAVLIALVGYQSFASRADGPSQAGLVATFDLEKTINTIDEYTAGAAKLLEIADGLQAKADDMRKDAEKIKKDLEDLPKGSAKYNAKIEEYASASSEYMAYVEFCKMKMDAEKGRLLKRIYQSVRKAAEELATEKSYAVVLVDDSVAQIPPGTLEDLNRQISARRVVYTNVDVTKEMVDRLNASFKAAGGVVPPPNPAKPAAKAP